MSTPLEIEISYRPTLTVQELRLVHKGLQLLHLSETDDSVQAQALARRLAKARADGFKQRFAQAEKLLRNIEATAG